MTASLIEEARSDADLVAAAVAGDREAFTSLVRRHQAMVAGLIYASVGDLHQSEELAQETFVRAWTGLRGLRNPDRLAGWLCQIARSRVVDAARRQSTERSGLLNLARAGASAPAPPADARVLAAEEQQLLWRTLAEIPMGEREAIVLYYRQGRSTADVAAALGITEDAVRQRLSRGRKLLRERVAGLLETGLQQSKPTAAFTVAVVAALPAVLPTTAKAAATIGTAAKGATSAAAAWAGLLLWIGPAMGVVGGVIGSVASIRAARSPRERRFIVRSAVLIWVFVLTAVAIGFGLDGVRSARRWSGQTYVLAQSAFWAIYLSLLIAMVMLLNRRQQRIRREEGLSTPPAAGDGWMSDAHLAWMILGTTVGATAWLFAMALQAHDVAAAAVLCVLVNVLIFVAIGVNRGKTRLQTMHYMLVHVAAIMAITAVTMNLRLHEWLATTHHITIVESRERAPLWVANVLLLVIGLGMEGTIWATARVSRERRNHEPTAG